MLSLKHIYTHIQRKSIRLNHIIAHWTQSINDSPKLNQVSEIESSQFICKNATHIDGLLFDTHSLRSYSNPKKTKKREWEWEAFIQYTKLVWNDYGSYLVRWLISNIICHRRNGRTEDQSLTINSEIPIYKIHIPCMALPFPIFFSWIPMAYNLPAVNFGLRLYLYLRSSLICTRHASILWLWISHYAFFVVVAAVTRPPPPQPSLSTSCVATRMVSSERINRKTLFGNSIVIYWLSIDLLQKGMEGVRNDQHRKQATKNKVLLNSFCWITTVFMHLIESYWICIRHSRTFYSV